MRCNHCGAANGHDQRVNFQRNRICELTLCEDCVQEFERDETVLDVTPAIAR